MSKGIFTMAKGGAHGGHSSNGGKGGNNGGNSGNNGGRPAPSAGSGGYPSTTGNPSGGGRFNAPSK